MSSLYNSLSGCEVSSEQSIIPGLLTDFLPGLRKETGGSGLVHPGIGLTREMLENVRKQIRRGAEPWRTCFEEMLVSYAAAGKIYVYLTDPDRTAFASQNTNGLFIRDSLTAYTQALLYYVTGDNCYRKNALEVLRAWSGLDPEKYAYFTDACIHVGIPMNRMCAGAEIIRYSTYRETEGYSDCELNWTEEEISRFMQNLIRPAVKTFLSSPNEFMNQHLYTVIGAMSAYLFMDDLECYHKTVEWFMVNREGKNPGFNGSISRLFREIRTIDEPGEAEGSGRPLQEPVIQHVEMGRDQAHGCGDLTNAAIIARLMLGQNTRVDPKTGTVSGAEDAVGVYEFLDDRILKAADYFLRYMLGYDTEWVAVPFSIRDGKVVDNYRAISPNYRGRYNTLNCWEIYLYYAHQRPDVDLERQYPYLCEGLKKRVPSNYYSCGRFEINWNNADGGGDFWLFIPAEMAGSAALQEKPQTRYLVEVRDRGVMVENKEAMSTREEDGTGYIRFAASEKESRLAITTGGTMRATVAFRVRTDGMAVLSLSNGVKGSVRLPDTGNKWSYITFTRKDSESFGDLYYITVSQIKGSYVDIGAIDIEPETENGDRDSIAVLRFAEGCGDSFHTAYRGAAVTLSFVVNVSRGGGTVLYEGTGLPEGACIEKETGLFTWRPTAAGSYSFYVGARAFETDIVKKVRLTIAENRSGAIRNTERLYDENTAYTAASEKNFWEVLSRLRKMEVSASDEAFLEMLREAQEAGRRLKPVALRLLDDPLTDGTSLNYPEMVSDSTMGKEIFYLTDGTGTFCGHYTAVEGCHFMDFGPDFKVSATKFGYQARYGFSDRLAGVQVFGSNDRRRWVRLTVGEAAFTQAYQEVEVREEEKESRFRYLKLCKTTEYPEALRGDRSCLLELGELRIFGNCYENRQEG